MEKIATDIYTFSRLREDGFTYVDKTDALYAMASGEVGAQFFIARPRRFGKSLAVSTLKSLFLGEREFFKGLAIEPKWDWSKKWPVLHLDMGSAQTESVPELKRRWRAILENECVRNGVPYEDDENPATVFERTINALAAKSPDGRIDMVVDLPNDIYIVEFKLDKPAAEAMSQIKGKDYAGKYALLKKRITLVGISFSSEKRTIVEELVEEIPAATA